MNPAENPVNPDGAKVFRVSEIVRRARQLLEASTPLCWISGEVSNLTRAASGHLYFTLKDEAAQLRCTMWRNRGQLLPFQLAEGMRVDLRAQLTVYEPRGDMQLVVEHIRRSGLGALLEALMQLKARLEREGLFDPANRRPLPAMPAAIGIVTSPAAAALHDVLVTLKRRAPALQVAIYPTQVQGDGAGELIAAAIRLANRRARQDGIEALIVCRGGGSTEDLWAFNSEAVVRAIREGVLPVVSGVGHETDTTLCDFAADLRAATPTAAAEAISAGYVAQRERLPQLQRLLENAVSRRLAQAQQRLDLAERALRHPRERIAAGRARLDQLALRLRHRHEDALIRAERRLFAAQARLARHRPQTQGTATRLDALQQRLMRAGQANTRALSLRLDSLASQLAQLNPDAVLERGYAIVRQADGGIVRNAADLAVGDRIALTLARGSAAAEVLSVDSPEQ